MDDIQFQFWSLSLEEVEIKTGCRRICRFNNYFNFYEQKGTIEEGMDEIFLAVKLSRSVITTKTETLIFPMRSLVADLGGTLGLFLGFSFLMIWDVFETFIIFLKHQLANT